MTVPDKLRRTPARRPTGGGSVSKFDPKKTQEKTIKADAVIKVAQRIRDWDMLKRAVDEQIAEQQKFVAWWQAKVQRAGGDRQSEKHLPRSPQMLSYPDAEKKTHIKHQLVSRWRRSLDRLDDYRAELFGPSYAKAMGVKDGIQSKWTGDPENYTPAVYIEASRQALGTIDLDPASNEYAQETVKAAKWFGAADDGLAQQWTGNVFLNPPFNAGVIDKFVGKLCAEHCAGNVSAAVLLSNNNTDTGWWHMAAAAAIAICFTKGRINFYKEDGERTQPTNGQTFFYFGDRHEMFDDVFSEFGLVLPC